MDNDKSYAESLLKEYTAPEVSNADRLRRLDAMAKLPANIFTYTTGIVSALVLGVGMCLTMGQIGSGGAVSMAFGIILGVIGIAGACVNYPVYTKLVRKGREQYKDQITSLAKEVENE